MTAAGGSPECLPSVSVVVPARNCAELLPGCLAAIGSQTYRGPLDLTVAVAPSDDGTEQVLANTSMELPLRVVESPAGTTPAGLNLAVAASDGEIVARVDSQSRVPPDYIERAVSTLTRTGAANVGGVQRPIGAGGLPSAIAAAMASAFGGGPAAFRHGRREGPVDTVYLGVFDRSALTSVGGFDETLQRNQDYELNWRLRERGHTVWLDPNLVVGYVPRSDYPGLASQYLRLRRLETSSGDAPSPIASLAPAGRPGSGSGPRGLGGRTRPGTPTRCRNSGAVRGSLRNCRRPVAAGSAGPVGSGSGCGRFRRHAPWMGRRLPHGPGRQEQPRRSARGGRSQVGGNDLAGFAQSPQHTVVEPRHTIAVALDLRHDVGY